MRAATECDTDALKRLSQFNLLAKGRECVVHGVALANWRLRETATGDRAAFKWTFLATECHGGEKKFWGRDRRQVFAQGGGCRGLNKQRALDGEWTRTKSP